MSEIKRVAKNSSYNFLTNLISKILSLILIIMLARYLGVEDYGKLSFVISFTALFAIIGDFGIRFLLRRRVARDKSSVNYHFVNALVLKALMNIASFFAIAFTAYILNYDTRTFNLIVLGALFVILGSMKTPFRAVYEAYERMHYVFWTRTGKIILRLVLIIILMYFKQDLFMILLSYVIVEAFMIIPDLFIYHNKICNFSWKVDSKSWKEYLKKSAPFGIAALFMTIYDKVDVTMLSKLSTHPDLVIGWYSSAYEFTSALLFIPAAISGAVAPIAFRAFLDNKKKLIMIYESLTKLFFILAIPIIAGGLILAQEIIFFIYGSEFTGSVLALQILLWALLFNFQMFSLGIALNSMDLEKVTMTATILSVIFNVVANFILIPRFSFLGAAITTVASVFIYCFYCFRVTQKKLVRISLPKVVYKPLIASLLMAVVLFYVHFHLVMFFSIPIGLVVYFSILFLLGGIDQDILNIVKKVKR